MTGSGGKCFWDNGKRAFRGGRLTSSSINSFNWDTDSLGLYSFSFGFDTKATGQSSIAYGRFTKATGENSIACGRNSKASGNNSTAFGFGTEAIGNNSTAFGANSTASGIGSTAFGTNSTASGIGSTAFGSSTASGQTSTAFGISTASGHTSTAFGRDIVASGSRTIAFGTGVSQASRLENNISSSLMIGFESTIPTLFVGPAASSSGTGNVSIGGNTSPDQKLVVSGAVEIGNTTVNTEGTIRYNGSRFQGRTGTSWKNLDEQSVWDKTGNTASYDGAVVIGSAAGSQQLDVEGAIKIGNTTSDKDFQGYHDTEWKNLDEAGGSSVWTLNGSETYYDSGNVGIGTTNPNHLLHVAGDLAVAGSVIAPSDRRLKENIQPITEALEIISALQPKTYKYKEEQIAAHGLSEKQQYGLIAQELEEVLPTLVSQQVILDEDGMTYKGVEYAQLIPILTQAIKELREENEELKDTTESLASRLEALEKNVVKN